VVDDVDHGLEATVGTVVRADGDLDRRSGDCVLTRVGDEVRDDSTQGVRIAFAYR